MGSSHSIHSVVSGRDSFIDVVRLLTMFFIVVGHVNIRTPMAPGAAPLLSIFSAMTLWSGVALYFCLAGYFSKPNAGWLNWHRAGDIFVSMLLWCIIGHFWFGALLQLEAGKEVSFASLVDGRLWNILGSWDNVGTPGSYDCWFLKVLIPLALLSAVLMRLNTSVLSAICVLSALFGYADYAEHGVPFFLTHKALQGLSFFSFGVILRRFVSLEQIRDWVSKIYIWFLAVTIPLAALNFMWHPVVANTTPLEVLWGMVYLLCIGMLFCKLLPRFSAWFASFGTGVFFIYMVQEMLVLQCRWYFTVHPINKHVYFLIPFAIFAVLMLGYAILRRYMPWACGVLCLSPIKKRD